MDISNFEKTFIKSMDKTLSKQVDLPERNELLLYLHNMKLSSGHIDVKELSDGKLNLISYDLFLEEARQLLVNAIFLYEHGYFDCAYYSVRQADEVLNTMLFLAFNDENIFSANDKTYYEKWQTKAQFPANLKMQEKLKEVFGGYKEIKSKLSGYFGEQKQLIDYANKIVHKQGSDTFYALRNNNAEEQKKDTDTFIKAIKYTIGMEIILFFVFQPLSLALADEKINSKINFDFDVTPLDYDFFNRFLGLNYIKTNLFESNYYKEVVSYFEDNEEMNEATYMVYREQCWDIEHLNDIEKQLHFLGNCERYMFEILSYGMKITNFYMNNSCDWYSTSYESNNNSTGYSSKEIDTYFACGKKFNLKYNNVYISIITIYNERFGLEHNEELSEQEQQYLNEIEQKSVEEYNLFKQKAKQIAQALG